MVVALFYLSCIHLHRQYYDYGSYSLDITGPLMIITQKVTSLAFSIHDGFTREMKDLTQSQQQHAIRKLPSPLEFFSYTLHFQGLMAGPLVFYKDYIDFIEGCHIIKHTSASVSSERGSWKSALALAYSLSLSLLALSPAGKVRHREEDRTRTIAGESGRKEGDCQPGVCADLREVCHHISYQNNERSVSPPPPSIVSNHAH